MDTRGIKQAADKPLRLTQNHTKAEEAAKRAAVQAEAWKRGGVSETTVEETEQRDRQIYGGHLTAAAWHKLSSKIPTPADPGCTWLAEDSDAQRCIRDKAGKKGEPIKEPVILRLLKFHQGETRKCAGYRWEQHDGDEWSAPRGSTPSYDEWTQTTTWWYVVKYAAPVSLAQLFTYAGEHHTCSELYQYFLTLEYDENSLERPGKKQKTEDTPLREALHKAVESQGMQDIMDAIEARVEDVMTDEGKVDKAQIKKTFEQYLEERLVNTHTQYIHLVQPLLEIGEYKNSAYPVEAQRWNCVHEDRIIIKPNDLPEAVLKQLVQTLMNEHSMTKEQVVELLARNLTVSMNFSCEACFAILSAVSGWAYKSGKRCKGGRWSCTVCSHPWNSDSPFAVAYVLRWDGLVFTFYGRWGPSQWIGKNWPEVHCKWIQWEVERTEYYSKYEPLNTVRDVALQTYGSVRVLLNDDTQRALLNHIMKPYMSTQEEVDDWIWKVHWIRLRHYVGRMGRAGWKDQKYLGSTKVRKLLADPAFVQRNKISTHKGPDGNYHACVQYYLLQPQDFACKSDGTPYQHDDEGAMDLERGGRIKLSAYARLFGWSKQKCPERSRPLLAVVCDDQGWPLADTVENADRLKQW